MIYVSLNTRRFLDLEQWNECIVCFLSIKSHFLYHLFRVMCTSVFLYIESWCLGFGGFIGWFIQVVDFAYPLTIKRSYLVDFSLRFSCGFYSSDTLEFLHDISSFGEKGEFSHCSIVECNGPHYESFHVSRLYYVCFFF